MSRKENSAEKAMVKALNPKDVDTKYMGEEPLFAVQPDSEYRASTLARAFTWYNRFYGRKEGKDLLIQYLEYNDRKTDAKAMAKVSDSEILTTLCWLARMKLRGLVTLGDEESTLANEINRLLKTVTNPETAFKSSFKSAEAVQPEVAVAVKPNIQDILREKASEACGEIEGLFDTFIAAGAKSTHSLRPIDELAKRNVMPQHVPIVATVWKKKLAEFETVLEGKDSQLVEGYGQFTKTQLKNIVKFIDGVLSDLNSYISVKKTARTPRARKPVPVEKIVAKLKYLKEFADATAKLNLVSIHPTKIHGASEAWVYDTAKRKLHHYIADEYSKTFTVKGNTLLGFDTATSEVKTLRKPAEQLKEIMGSKPAARKYFKDIKATSTAPNGRFNENMIIVKAF
jgi:hypothetical protein